MLRVMIVDDDFLICDELKGIVTDLKYEVVGVTDSGKAAVEMALDVKPDVILMDIVMENGMDGIEAAGKIKESHDCAVRGCIKDVDLDSAICQRTRASSAGVHGHVRSPISILLPIIMCLEWRLLSFHVASVAPRK